MITLLTRAEVDGRLVDVLLDDDRVRAVSTAALSTTGVDEVVDAGGRALVPGLHDHHLHLLAIAAARTSVDCGPGAVGDAAGLAAALRRAPGTGWVRGFGYHESVAGDLDRTVLDAALPDRPVRVQHRSGALWVLNSRALAEVGPLPTTPDVEYDVAGPTGRLWRLDRWLAGRLPSPSPPDLAAVGRDLRRYGVTGVTDATPDLDGAAVGLLDAAVRAGDLPAVTVLARDVPASSLAVGPVKILLHDHDLPDYDDLRRRVLAARAASRAVAVHVVTRTAMVLLLAVLDEVGARPGDRVEHGAVVPPDLVPMLARHGVVVVTQPGFLRERGDDYLRDVEPDDQPYLYPHDCLLRGGVGVALSSDAPYGPLDPWQVIAAAADRRSRSGRIVGEDRPVDPVAALAGYLSPADDPGGPPRQVRPGALADLVLLNGPLAGLAGLLPDPVARVWASRR